MKNFMLIIPLFIGNLLFAQNNCKCDLALEKLIETIEKNYTGFEEKTKDKILYDYFKNNLIEKSKITNDADCMSILKDYTSFFKDRHIFFLDNSNYLTHSKYSKKEIFELKQKTIEKIIKSKNGFEGIWQNEEYKIAIVKAKDEYNGIVISSKNNFWKPNDILFKIDKDKNLKYYNSDLTFYNDSVKEIDNTTLQLQKLRTYFIKDTSNYLSETEIKNKISRLEGFYIEKLSSKTVLLRLRTFDYPFVEKIKNLIFQNKELIENSENLIVDLRQNGGGTTDAFKPLLPYIMTGSTRELNVEFLATDFLISGLSNYMRGLPDNEENNKKKIKFQNYISNYEANLGKFVINPDEKEVETTNYEIPKKAPKQVVFLADKGVGSSAENLLLLAKQSKKVKIIGTPTSGVLDYASARISNYDCNNTKLVLPTYRSLRLPDFPIDNIGVQPDIFMDKYVEDWTKYAVEYLEN